MSATGDAVTTRVPEMGISDVNPRMFVGLNTPSGFAEVTETVASKLTVEPGFSIIFGIPVSLPLYNALQVAQGLVAGGCAVGDNTDACTPSLSKNQVASLFNGGVPDWGFMAVDVGGVPTPLTSVPGVTPPSVSDVEICRRVNGSGTQAQFNAKFTHAPCTVNAFPILSAQSGFPIVKENSSSGGVTTCLDDATAANRWSLGIQSLEKVEPASFKFIKIDGVAPTLKNAATNKYFDMVENTFQFRTGALSADQKVLFDTLSTNAVDPVILNGLNGSFPHPFGTGAYLTPPGKGFSPSYPHDDSNPVATSTHKEGAVIDNCRVPKLTGGTMMF
jgi:hypothetical protein